MLLSASPAVPRKRNQKGSDMRYFAPKHFPPRWTPVRRRKCDKRVESKAHPGSVSSKIDSISSGCALAAILFGAAALGGCSEGVLAPKGPVAAAERLIMLNSTGIMLAIVIPTMLATLGVAYWFRSSN